MITERQEKIYTLKAKAQCRRGAALQLYHIIKLECGIILEDPNAAPESIVRAYNHLVRNYPDLPLPERKELLLEEKKK